MKIPDVKSAYQKGKPGLAKKQNKSQKRQVIDSLKQAFKLAKDGLVALIQHEGKKYYMLREDKYIEALQNQGRVNMPQELKNFMETHQELMYLMNSLQYEIKDRDQFESDEDYEVHVKMMTRNNEIFDDLDDLTLDFSSGMSKTKEHRKIIVKKYKDLFDKYPL